MYILSDKATSLDTRTFITIKHSMINFDIFILVQYIENLSAIAFIWRFDKNEFVMAKFSQLRATHIIFIENQ